MSDTCSNPNRTPVPIEVGQVFEFQVGHFFGGVGMGVRHRLERDSNSSRTLVPIQIGHLFQGKPDRYSNTKSDGYSWLPAMGSAGAWNESVGVEGRYTPCQKGSVQLHEERNLYGTKSIIHASDQRNHPTEVSTSIIGASHRPQLRALSQHGGRLSPTRQGRRAELAFARRTERGAVARSEERRVGKECRSRW